MTLDKITKRECVQLVYIVSCGHITCAGHRGRRELRFGGGSGSSGPPRLDLRLFNSSACQKHQCTLCSLLVFLPSFSFVRPIGFSLFSLPTASFLSFLYLCFSRFPIASMTSEQVYVAYTYVRIRTRIRAIPFDRVAYLSHRRRQVEGQND